MKSIFRPFSQKKGGNEAENNCPPFFPEKGRKIDFLPGRKAEGRGRFLPEANIKNINNIKCENCENKKPKIVEIWNQNLWK